MECSKTKRNLLVTLLSFIVGMIYFLPYVRITFYDQTIEALQLTNTQLGNLASIYGTVAIFCYLIGSYLSQKFSSRILIAVSLIGTGAATIWQATFPSYSSLIVIYVLYAIFTTATLWAPYIAMLRSFGTDAEQGRLFGISESLRSVISTLVGFLFIWIFSLFTEQIGGYRIMLIIGAALYFMFAVLALIMFPKNIKSEKKERSSFGSLVDALKIPGVWLVSLFIFACYFLNCGGAYYFGTYTTQILGTSEAISSVLQIIRTYILAIGLGVIGGIVADKFKYRSRFLAILVAAAAVASFVMPLLASHFWAAIVVSVLISGLNYMIKSIYYSVMDEAVIPRHLTGAAAGIIGVVAYTPDAFIGSIVGPWLDANPNTGFTKLFILMGCCGVLAVASALILNRVFIKNQQAK